MTGIYGNIRDILNSGCAAVIITVLDKQGSSSMDAGTKMIVRDDFSTIGSIGGGLLEAIAIRLAAKTFENKSFLIERRGPLLSAEYIDRFDPDAIDYFGKLAEYINEKQGFVSVTRFRNSGEIIREFLLEEDFPGFMVNEDQDELAVYCPIYNRDSVYIFGAGYIGQKLSKLTNMLGFHTVVLDNRHEFANSDRIPDADHLIVLESFRNIGKQICIDKNSYIIVATRGHAADTEILAEVLRSEAKYIGMLGSRKKRDDAFRELMQKGLKTSDLRRIHSPIGLNINAVTPEDITVSIAAELVMVRRSSNG